MPRFERSLLELTSSFLAARDLAACARLIVAEVAASVPNCSCVLYRPSAIEAPAVPLAVHGDVRFRENAGDALPAIAENLAASAAPIVFAGQALRVEQSAHLQVAHTVRSLTYILLRARNSVRPSTDRDALLEIVSFGEVVSGETLAPLEPLLRLSAEALLTAELGENERNESLHSIHRMSQLYDLEKSLNATLELSDVSALAPEKVRTMLDCQAIHLWLFDGEILRLTASSGDDATVKLDMTQEPGEGYVADMAEEGEVVLIDDPEDPRLSPRNSWLGMRPATPPIRTVLLAPLMQDEAEVGVLEAINKAGGAPFDDDDIFFLTTMAETVSSALKNATLMHAERKLEILETLVHVSSEITSTLRLDRLMQIIVNSPQTVLPYERCAIALENRGALQLKAVSGRQSLPIGDVQVDQLNELVRWLATQAGVLYLKQKEDDPDQLVLPKVVQHHFEVTGNRGLYSVPLVDDQGRVGLLLYEAADPDFLDLPQIEMIKVLAGQATVAIRNALLYREVPLISLLEPLVKRKNALFRDDSTRRLVYSIVASLAVLFFLFFPFPMRISGPVTIAPLHTVDVDAPLDGNIVSVNVQEGQRVGPGQVLGALNDWQWRADLSSAEARYHSAQLTMEQDLARGSAQAGADRMQVDLLRAEAERVRTHIQDAQMKSPIAGVVTTPNVENLVGKHLDAGASFAQVLDLSSAVVDVQVAQGDVRYIAPGQKVSVKLDSFPQRVFRGTVDTVSPEALVTEGSRVFVVRVPLENDQALLRAGMAGDAKIFVGYRPVGDVLFRRPFFWLWHLAWNWIGW